MLPWLLFTLAIKFAYSQDESQSMEPVNRIHWGRNTTIEEHPYFVSVERNNVFVSEGVLISSNLVLTSAHLVQNKSDLFVRAGTRFRQIGGRIVYVKQTHIMEKFNPTTREYDVAILVLQYNYNLSKVVNFIKLADIGTDPTIRDPIKMGFYVQIVGWGLVKGKEGVLQMLNVQKVPCDDAPREVPDHMACFSILDSYARPASDAGGPLVFDDTLHGIDSWNYEYKKDMFKTVYMKILDWDIHNFIAEYL